MKNFAKSEMIIILEDKHCREYNLKFSIIFKIGSDVRFD